MKIIKLSKVLSTVDDVRLLTKKASGLPISNTIKDLAMILSDKLPWCLCGGLAVGVHSRPRGTDDIDILLKDDSLLLYIYAITSHKFKKTSDHVIVHRQTGVAVDLLTPSFINVNSDLVHKAIETSKISTLGNVSIPVVSRDGLVALKLSRGEYLDLGDIQSILKHGGDVDLKDYPLNEKQLKLLKEIKSKIK